MKLNDEHKLLVLVGGWNRHIFTKEWVSKYLLPDEDLEIEFSLNINGGHRISSKNIRIEVEGIRLSFLPRKNDSEIFEKIENLSIKLADYLPHTPVSAFGVNFIYNGSIDEIGTEFISFHDNNMLNQIGANIQNSNHSHTLELDGKKIILKVNSDNQKVIIDFNFHFDIKRLTEFKEKLYDNKIMSLNRQAEKILQDVYQLKVE